MDWLGNRIGRFIGLCSPEQQFGYFSLFASVLGNSELELHSVCFFGFLTMCLVLICMLNSIPKRMN